MIGRSLTELKPGDTLYVKKETYRESIMLTAKPDQGFPSFPSENGYGQMISFSV